MQFVFLTTYQYGMQFILRKSYPTADFSSTSLDMKGPGLSSSCTHSSSPGNSVQNSPSARRLALPESLFFCLSRTELAPSRLGRSPAPTAGRLSARSISLEAVLQINFTVYPAYKIIVHNFDILTDQHNRLA